MSRSTSTQHIPLPKSWPKYIKSAMLHVISLAHVAMTYSRGWAVNSGPNAVEFQILVSFLEGRRHLPIVELRQAA